MYKNYLAHPPDEFGNGLQGYKTHITGVIRRSTEFFSHVLEFSNFTKEEVQYIEAVLDLAATYHDLGKLDTDSQRLMQNQKLLKMHKMINHVDAGTSYCIRQGLKCKNVLNPFVVAAYLIQAHHLGLGYDPDNQKHNSFVKYYENLKLKFGEYSIRDKSLVKNRSPHIQTNDTVEEFVDKHFFEILQRHQEAMNPGMRESLLDLPCPFVTIVGGKIDHGCLEHIIRLMLSILVEADRGDTSANYEGHVRYSPLIDKVSPTKRLENVQAYVDSLSVKFFSKPHTAKELEKQELRGLLQKVAFQFDYSKSDVFVLNAAVGCGKTTAALISALRIEETFKNANGRSSCRIMCVSPVNAPGKQASVEFRKAALSPNEEPFLVVGENYQDTNYKSMAEDAEVDSDMYSVLSKTWDFPITVSSCEQFFRTICGNATSSLRKYWNLSNAVIIIDEYQTLPPSMLERLWDCMVFLSKKLNVKFLLVSGTPTEFYKTFNAGRLIVENVSTRELDRRMFEMEDKRVKYSNLGYTTEFSLVDKISESVLTGSALTVCCTTLTAAYIYTLLCKKLGKDKVIYISRCLTGKDVDDNIEDMKKRLANKEKFAVVSTSMLEAGIDVSFASVFGEYSRFTSIFQLAGRCNRHNELSVGNVYLFELPKKANLITENPSNIHSRMVVKEFIKKNRLSYLDCADAYDMEIRQIKQKLNGNKDIIAEAVELLDFRTIANIVHAIEPDSEKGSDFQVLIKEKAIASGVLQKLVYGEKIEASEMADVCVTMKSSRIEKIQRMTNTLRNIINFDQFDFKVHTEHNKAYEGMYVWVGNYTEIGYLGVLLDPKAFV